MHSSIKNKGKVYSFQDNSPISKNNSFNALLSEAKEQNERAQDNVDAKVKLAKIFIWLSEGMVQKDLTYDPTKGIVFVKETEDTDIVLFRKLGSQWFTGNYVGVLSLGNDICIEIYSRFEHDKQEKQDKHDKHKFAFINHMLNKIYDLNDWLLTQGGSNKTDLNFDLLLKLSFLSKLKKAYREGEYKSYEKVHKNDTSPRGTIDIARHIKLNLCPENYKVAYSYNEYTSKNNYIYLVRLCYEMLFEKGKKPKGKEVDDLLFKSQDYWSYDKRQIIHKNENKPITSPLFKCHRDLQKFCLDILRHKKMTLDSFGTEDGKYGVLIDCACLWEEYVATLLKDYFIHKTMSSKDKDYLFVDKKGERFQRIIPDYVGKNSLPVIADAKYMDLYGRRDLQDEQRSSVYYKTVMYMLRYQSKLGMIFYPSKSEGDNAEDKPRATTESSKPKENAEGNKTTTNNESNNSNEINESNKTKANVDRWSIDSNVINGNCSNDNQRLFHLISLNLNCLGGVKTNDKEKSYKVAVDDELSKAEASFKRAVKESIESLNKILENTGMLTG